MAAAAEFPPPPPPSEGPPWAVELRDLRVDYGETLAVNDLTLQIRRGEVFGLVGPNGAGKTSTFKVLATLLEPTYGEVRIGGLDLAEEPSAVRSRLGYMPDLAPVPSDLRVWEFLDFFGAAHGLSSQERAERSEESLQAVRLTEKRQAKCSDLSRGMKQRLVLAKVMLHRPELLILDEPASGMDPLSRLALRESLQAWAKEGRAVVVSSHILGELSEMCTRIGVLHQGALLAEGPVDEVANRLAGQGRKIRVRFLPGPRAGERMASLVQEDPAVTGLELEEGEAIFFYAGQAEEQVALLRRLVEGGLQVESFAEERARLEEALVSLDGGEQE
ncbi:MAG: ABC transporter ATP-binding protein [Verrucomicrobiota bacterium]